jgi:predicted nucleic acid-binding protein
VAAVSDTSPLNYLTLIEAIDILPVLFERIILPPAVASELQHANTPAVVRSWIAAGPSWLEVRTPADTDPQLTLGAGEVEAIALALELGADWFLVDDSQARRAAVERKLKAVGTLAILAEGARRGLLDFNEALNRLGRTNFRATSAVLTEVRRSVTGGGAAPG